MARRSSPVHAMVRVASGDTWPRSTVKPLSPASSSVITQVQSWRARSRPPTAKAPPKPTMARIRPAPEMMSRLRIMTVFSSLWL